MKWLLWMKNTKISMVRVLALCLVTVLVCTATFGGILVWQLPSLLVRNAAAGKIGEIADVVADHYVGEYDPQVAEDIAANAYLAGVGDRWSWYMTAQEYDAYKTSFAGESIGIGLWTSYNAEQNTLRIIEVYAESEGVQAGMQKGDYILGADGVTMEEDGREAVLAAIAGEEGTTVDVTFCSGTTDAVTTATLTRKTTTQTMVHGELLEGNIGFVRIYNFHQQVEEQFEQVVTDLLEQGAQKLVFDVRNNGGGSVDSLCEMLDLLLPEGDLMTLQPKSGQGTVYTSDAACVEVPMAVLANAQSISAAEFFAAALQEYGVAQVFGEQTVGKGYSQRRYVLSDGAALSLSDQTYFTPQGKSLIDVGVVPDVEVALAESVQADFYFLSVAQDSQLKAAVEWLQTVE